LSAVQRPLEAQLADLESHNAELQEQRDELRRRVDDLEAGGEALVTEIKIERSDDITSRYWLTFRVARTRPRMYVCLDLQVSVWEGESQRRLRWSGKTRHALRTIEPAIQGQTQFIQLVDEGQSMFESNAPVWKVASGAVEGLPHLATPLNYQKAAIVFVADEVEQEFRMVGLPREPGEALAIIDENHLNGANFWGEAAPKLTMRLTRGLREMTTPEARGHG